MTLGIPLNNVFSLAISEAELLQTDSQDTARREMGRRVKPSVSCVGSCFSKEGRPETNNNRC